MRDREEKAHLDAYAHLCLLFTFQLQRCSQGISIRQWETMREKRIDPPPLTKLGKQT